MNLRMLWSLSALGFLAVISAGLAQSGGGYDLSWNTFNAGGGTSTGGSYALSGTIGQPDARSTREPMTGGVYSMTGGFWVIPECPAIPADYDGDCDVDQADYMIFEACASGPEVPYVGDCDEHDFDEDGDIDQSDFGTFQRCYSGQDNPADPSCAD